MIQHCTHNFADTKQKNMKRQILLLSFFAATLAANAQTTPFSLTGTSYTQNFDNLGTGTGATIPDAGWYCFSGATSSGLGTADATFGPTTLWGVWGNDNGMDTLTGTGCASDVFGHGFKNCASNDPGAATSSMNCAAQEAITNRALGVRQASGTTYPGFDPGPSFAFEMANTSGRTGFHLTFNLESLDTLSPRQSTWTVDYGIGATPTVFTAVTPTSGTMTTGGNTFSNSAINVTFPTAIENQSTPVWIRISTLSPTTGSGARTTTGIDDFHLTWTGTGPSAVTNVVSDPAITLSVLGSATADKIVFGYSAEGADEYTFIIYDMAGRTLYNSAVKNQPGAQQFAVTGLHLASGMYFARMSNASGSAVAKVIVQ